MAKKKISRIQDSEIKKQLRNNIRKSKKKKNFLCVFKFDFKWLKFLVEKKDSKIFYRPLTDIFLTKIQK